MDSAINQLNSIINQLPSNPWITLISLILAALSILLAIYFGIRSLPRKKITVTFEHNELLSIKEESLSKLNITYDNKRIEKITISKMIFWNSSFPTINKGDIINADPFSIILTDGELLDISVLKGDDTPNRINIACSTNNSAQISFDYLDRKEGGIIQIIHTGTRSSVDVTKLLKGGKISLAVLTKFNEIKIFLLIIALVLFFTSLFSEEKRVSYLQQIFRMFIGIGVGLVSTLLINRRFIPKNCKKEKRTKN